MISKDYREVKYLYIDSRQIVKNSMLWGFLENELNIERAILDIDIYSCSDESVNTVINNMNEYDIAVSQDFIPDVATACHKLGKIYISWVYDAPQMALFTEEAKYDTNYIFMFDKASVHLLKNKGVKNIYHLPLAANILQAGMIDITDEDIEKYSCDVSFVGGLYQKDYINNIISQIGDENIQELKQYLGERCTNFADKKEYEKEFSDGFTDSVFNATDTSPYKDKSADREFVANALVGYPLLALNERAMLINKAAEKYNTRLYTNSKDTSMIKANVFPPVDYETQMYKVFYSSKINLNITWRGIVSGLPQRIFDIMAVGGFVLTNYQSEIPDMFEIGKEIEVFHNINEYEEKLAYYLSHDRERITIGINGYKKVKELYNYKLATLKMLSIVFGDKHD